MVAINDRPVWNLVRISTTSQNIMQYREKFPVNKFFYTVRAFSSPIALPGLYCQNLAAKWQLDVFLCMP